jgi:FKBP-type peptidyl-prolyl cis-trans isomerase
MRIPRPSSSIILNCHKQICKVIVSYQISVTKITFEAANIDQNNTKHHRNMSSSDFQPISKDGQVKKRIIKEGTGDATPPLGSSVSVHYVGTLTSNGKKFDSSRDKNRAFSFLLGMSKSSRMHYS